MILDTEKLQSTNRRLRCSSQKTEGVHTLLKGTFVWVGRDEKVLPDARWPAQKTNFTNIDEKLSTAHALNSIWLLAAND